MIMTSPFLHFCLDNGIIFENFETRFQKFVFPGPQNSKWIAKMNKKLSVTGVQILWKSAELFLHADSMWVYRSVIHAQSIMNE